MSKESCGSLRGSVARRVLWPRRLAGSMAEVEGSEDRLLAEVADDGAGGDDGCPVFAVGLVGAAVQDALAVEAGGLGVAGSVVGDAAGGAASGLVARGGLAAAEAVDGAAVHDGDGTR